MEKENKIVEPMLDMNEIQKKANEFALKGAIECIKDYYTGYNSPFKKAIEEHLDKSRTSFCFTMPEIMGVINESLSSQIDIIANEAIDNLDSAYSSLEEVTGYLEEATQ